MSKPAVFFDRDNTLIASDGYLGDPAQVRLIDGAADAVARVRSLGYAVVVCSNQSGVARGYFDEEAVRAVNARVDELLSSANPAALIDRHEFCPFHPEAVLEAYRQESELRKPRPGMLLAAARALDLDLPHSWLVGDAPRDIEAGHAAGCRTILFTDPALARSPAAAVAGAVAPDAVVGSLADAADIIADDEIPLPDPLLPDHAPTPPAEAPSSPQSQPLVSRIPAAPPEHTGSAPVMKAPPSPPASPSPADAPEALSLAHLQQTAEQILQEIRRAREHEPNDFSVSKLLAGIVQILVLGVLFFAYLNRDTAAALQSTLLLALTLQTLTISLLIMGKQR
jgi:D-glycero-D-manno-heptose 1,7-bisphosphate phosphatase